MADDALQQIRFLGASITNFSVNLGWSGSSSTLTVDLVEDDVNGDVFIVPQAGSAQYFSYGAFIFGGIVQKWVATGSVNGLPTFQVILNDPRDLLNGVQLVLNGYTGVTYSVPNLYNIYGYLENTVGFGSSHLNDSGMPWKKVRDTFLTLQNSTPISFRNDTYTIDLSDLPVMADEYRIGGGVSITLMDFINQICGDSSRDYFFYLDLGNVLRLVTINRQDAPTLGLLSQYISSTTGVSSKEVGVELRNEVCSKFVVGGKECKMFFNNFQYQYILDSNSLGEIDDVNLRTYYTDLDGDRFDIDYESMTVQQYWGLDKDGNVILPKVYETYVVNEITDFESPPTAVGNPAVGPAIAGGAVDRNWVYRAIRLDTRGLEVLGLGEWYDTDEQEMRALLAGYNSWCAFLALNDTKLDSPHFNKFTAFNMIADFDPKEYELAITTGDFSHFKPIDAKDFSPLRGKMVRLIAESTGRTHEENLKTIFNKFHDYAEEYYGKKFMVRIPFVLATIDDNQVADTTDASVLGASTNTDVIRTTMQPAELGFLEEDLWDDAVSQNYLPLDFYKFQSPDDRFEAYCRFDSAYRLDVSDIAERDYALGVQYQQKRKDKNAEDLSFFVRAKAEPDLVFLDRATAYSPRAVISLPGQVRNLLDSPDAVEDRATFDGLFRNDVTKKLVDFKIGFLETYWNSLSLKIKQDNDMFVPGSAAAPYWDASFADKVAWYYYTNVLIPKVGAEQVFFGNDGTPLNPSMIALPLLSNINTYGPWYIIGQNGKVEFEQDENLVPWNYGNYTNLNAAAEAKVVEAVSNQLDSETGTLEFPGIPSANLGGSLITGGPYVTGIDVNVGQQGVTTTYRMETWTQRFGRQSKQAIDKLQKTVNKMQQQKQAIYNLYGKNTPGNAALQPIIKQKFTDDVKRRSASSTHGFIIGEVLDDGSGVGYRVNAAIAPTYNLAAAIGGASYSGKALMTIDGLLRPFSTSPAQYWNLPHYETPTVSGANSRSVTELNPFQAGNDIHTIAQGSGIPEDTHLRNMTDPWKRPLGLRTPMVLVGWGYDTNGKPVPNQNPITPNDSFASGHLSRTDLWKAGPLDVKWDNNRKVWVTGGASLNVARLDAVLTAGGNALATVQNISISGASLIKTNGINITVYDMLTPASYGVAIAPSGAYVYVQPETTSGRYLVTGVGGW